MDFKEIKRLYIRERQNQKNAIVDWLLSEGFNILTMSGKISISPHLTGSGKTTYTSDSRIKSYDLSNWKWISARNGEREYLISLQAFDIDPKTRDRHVLMDRIGIYIYPRGKYNPEDCVEKMINTDIDLPMDQEKFVLLRKLLMCVDQVPWRGHQSSAQPVDKPREGS
ncbi:hypothetical protein SAMN04515656_11525 [Eubacterium aggregans]|uniref:Uncharacterized protein n=1 Tax=Eubacterium aggregans TaxID=81409 RepID=A0A1H4CEV3_9FIRM|nr:hypothetical protein [Eubacterium aggregans]MDD4508275.1 hypothetical protein [Eubacteriaceae bacterium]SEA58931.1 hypothetical protein SAMN04515656_11525 [Eubacterium aggregans]